MAKKAKEKDAEAGKGGEGGEAPAGKFAFLKNKKLLIIAGGGGVAVIGLVVGALFFFGVIGGKAAPKGEEGHEVAAAPAAGGHGAKPAEAAAKPAAGGHGAAPAAGGHGAAPAAGGGGKQTNFFDLPELTVNLTTNGQRPQYLRLKLALELPEGQLPTQVEPMVPRVLDSFQVFLRDLRPSDLEGSAAVYRLKEELTRRVNLAAQPVKIDAVLLREILVQ